MVRTYQYGKRFKFQKSPKDSYGYELMEKVGLRDIGDKTDHPIVFVNEMQLMRKALVEYDEYGFGMRDLETGKVWKEGQMDEDRMDEMDKKLKLSRIL